MNDFLISVPFWAVFAAMIGGCLAVMFLLAALVDVFEAILRRKERKRGGDFDA